MAKNHSTRANGARTPAAGYIRMSSHKQETSPAQQRREIIELAKRMGYPTPQQAGAIGSAHWIHGIGYVVDAIECRDFDTNAAEYGY